MRIKSIKKGTKFVRFDNYSEKDARIYLNKALFMFIKSRSFMEIDCKSFVVGIPLEHFPDMNLYSNCHVSVTLF